MYCQRRETRRRLEASKIEMVRTLLASNSEKNASLRKKQVTEKCKKNANSNEKKDKNTEKMQRMQKSKKCKMQKNEGLVSLLQRVCNLGNECT